MHKYLKSLWARLNRHLGKMWVRLLALVFAALGGFTLGKVGSPWFLGLFPEEIYGDVRTVISAVPFTLPTFLTLWWFRTYDSLQSDWRANFEAGVDHIASNTPTRIEIGTEMLKNVSKVTSIYNREISTAFIRRLNQCPAEAEANYKMLDTSTGWKYAQQMLKWLINQNEKYDLDFVDLRNQDFTDVIAGITVCDLINMNKDNHLTLEVARCNFKSMRDFFDCGAHTLSKWVVARHMNRKQIQRSNTVEFPSVKITVSRDDCGGNSDASANTAK